MHRRWVKLGIPSFVGFRCRQFLQIYVVRSLSLRTVISIEAGYEKGEMPRGASTISQQLAKNLYLSPSRNPIRKLREALITWRLESNLTKNRILELYLNLIEWGEGIFGAEAAARYYFKKPASSLSAYESAYLAAIIPSPRKGFNPRIHPQRVERRAQLILRRMSRVNS